MNCIELNYQLAELPSAQHRAGLAGLVLMTRELRQQPWFFERENPVVEFIELKEYSATLKLNLEGLKALFDLTYKTLIKETATNKKRKKTVKKKKVDREPDRIDEESDKPFIYYDPLPHGGFIPVWDKSSDEEDQGLWLNLWRDMLFKIVKVKSASRTSFKERMGGIFYDKDAQKFWQDLQNPEKIVSLSGSYLLGAESKNAEIIETKDLLKYQFLLQFWIFVVQVYRPAKIDKEGKRELWWKEGNKNFSWYGVAIPDVANLVDFCGEFQDVLEARSKKKHGSLPLEAIIDLPEEGALDLLRLLKQRISHKTGSQTLEDLILGVELIHVERNDSDNKTKILSISYVEPIMSQVDRYAEIQNAYWCPWFRKQRLLNLLNSQPESDEPDAPLIEIPAWIGFEAVLSRNPRKWLLDPYFSHDARELFNIEGEIKMKNDIRKEAQIVYQVCQHYVLSKLESKYQMVWDKKLKKPTESGNPIEQAKFDEKKYKIANEAFLAVRSRTETQAFIDYFVSTLYPYVRKEEFAEFADKLFNQTDEIRALTLLALASQFPSSKKSEENNNSQSEAA